MELYIWGGLVGAVSLGIFLYIIYLLRKVARATEAIAEARDHLVQTLDEIAEAFKSQPPK